MLKRIKNNIPLYIIIAIAVLIRIALFIWIKPSFCQHDVLTTAGHCSYAVQIFKTGKLVNSNFNEFSQPPLNAIMQALLMKVVSLFRDYGNDYVALYTPCKILSLIYSLITLFLFYKIVNEFDLEKWLSNTFFGIMALYPGIIIATTQYSNDGIAYMFFYLSLYLTIRWAKTKKLSTIILLALSIGFGMLSKISVGLIAFITGPMMLVVLVKAIKENCDKESLTHKRAVKARDIVFQLIIFALIVFPVGLSYSIRNYMLFSQKFGEIYDIAKNTEFNTSNLNFGFADRYLTLAFNKLHDGKYDIFHDWQEYNIWVDLIKTSAFDEFQLRYDALYPFFYVIWFLNIVFYFVTFIATIYNMVTLIIHVVKHNIKSFAFNMLNLRIMSLVLYFLAIFAFLSFNLTYKNYSCNSNYRYVQYITLALAGSLIVMIYDLKANIRR